MIAYFKSLFGASKPKPEAPCLPPGLRAYAVGDIHGCSHLLMSLIEAIESDIAEGEKDGVQSQVILLGDLVDRGPDSAGVVELARKWKKLRDINILCGNHEEMFLASFTHKDTLRHFLRHGGRETLYSYGIDRKVLTRANIAEVQAMMEAHVPAKHRKFIESFEDLVQLGDYLFVHAGIEPGVPLHDQQRHTLRWIREPFLSYGRSHGLVVVHGHTITDEVVDAGNRIGIDTGAYASGRLTALVLEGTSRRYLTAVETGKGQIAIKGERIAA